MACGVKRLPESPLGHCSGVILHLDQAGAQLRSQLLDLIVWKRRREDYLGAAQALEGRADAVRAAIASIDAAIAAPPARPTRRRR